MQTPQRRHRQLALGLAVSAVVATLAALASLYTVSLLPPGLHSRELQISAAAAHVLVQLPPELTPTRRATASDIESLSKRTALLGQLMASAPVVDEIARRMRLAPQEIAAVAQITGNVPATMKEPDSEQRGHDIVASHDRYRLDVQSKPNVPVLDVYTQAPTPASARRLANAAIQGLRTSMRRRAARAGADPAKLVTLRQIGATRGGVINGGAPVQIAGLTFVVMFGVTWGLLLLGMRLRRRTPAARDGGERSTRATRGAWAPSGRSLALAVPAALPPLPRLPFGAPGPARSGGERALAEDKPPSGSVGAVLSDGIGDWPRTTRLLPWLLAAFIAVLWLVPFNEIELSVSTPIDLKFDRLVLPVVFAAWILAIAAGGPASPRLRWTRIHTGVGIFVLLALLGVIVNAPYLSQTLEFDLAIKKLVLLVAYVSLFVIVASVVRRTEIRAFLTFTLILGVICALGTIWEYRFKYNVFYDLSDKLLPGLFNVGVAESGAVDEIGRRLTRGPAELGLEAVAMLTMALPIAMVGIIHAHRARQRILYGLAACVLLAATISTYRKSAFLAPISVVATLVYFRRDYIKKLLPVGLVLVLAVPILSPGALGSIAQQLDRKRLSVATVSDRASDYDAIRPDLWAHFAIGRGFGTYDHTSYRILDSEILVRLVEMGVLGLAAYLLMSLCVVAGGRRLIRRGEPELLPVAMCAASIAVAFIVMSALFDVLAFPHVPYLFMTWAGLLAVALSARPEET
jgi:hypothetical protein